LLQGCLFTDLDLREFIKLHKNKGGLLTMAATRKKVFIDLCVLEAKQGIMTYFKEKATVDYSCSDQIEKTPRHLS
jgi:NDP-sugar pyrophosphorylase family protein